MGELPVLTSLTFLAPRQRRQEARKKAGLKNNSFHDFSLTVTTFASLHDDNSAHHFSMERTGPRNTLIADRNEECIELLGLHVRKGLFGRLLPRSRRPMAASILGFLHSRSNLFLGEGCSVSRSKASRNTGLTATWYDRTKPLRRVCSLMRLHWSPGGRVAFSQ